jgi:hypothetical protein
LEAEKPAKKSRHYLPQKTFCMKKYSLGLLAVILAVAASAFTVPSHKTTALQDLFWFNPGATVQPQSTVDVATLSDEETNVCPGDGIPCKDGYESVTDLGDGRYQANGTPLHQIEKQ